GNLVAAIVGEALFLWDAATGRERFAVHRAGSGYRSLAFAPDGKTLATGGDADGNMIRLWNVQTGKELLSLAEQGRFNCLAFAPEGRLLACGGISEGEGKITLWEYATGKKVRTLTIDAVHFPFHAQITTIAF